MCIKKKIEKNQAEEDHGPVLALTMKWKTNKQLK
jgi:hypothetical protein